MRTATKSRLQYRGFQLWPGHCCELARPGGGPKNGAAMALPLPPVPGPLCGVKVSACPAPHGSTQPPPTKRYTGRFSSCKLPGDCQIRARTGHGRNIGALEPELGASQASRTVTVPEKSSSLPAHTSDAYLVSHEVDTCQDLSLAGSTKCGSRACIIQAPVTSVSTPLDHWPSVPAGRGTFLGESM